MRPTISMPKSKSYDDDDGATGSTAARSAKSSSIAGEGKQQHQSASGNLPGNAQGNQNAGWFGGLWNKFSLKPKNQMILPDDKNPTIVWDKERKCWTNTEGNAEESEAFKPPPKMSDMGMGIGMGVPTNVPTTLNTLGTIPTPLATPNLLPQQQQQQQQSQNSQELPNVNMYDNQLDYDYNNYGESGATAAPALSASPIPTAVPTISTSAAGGAQPKLQSNMFKIKRNRTLKNSYVDVFNPSGAPMSNAPQTVLAPIMAPVAVPQGGFFVPGAVPTSQQPPQ